MVAVLYGELKAQMSTEGDASTLLKRLWGYTNPSHHEFAAKISKISHITIRIYQDAMFFVDSDFC